MNLRSSPAEKKARVLRRVVLVQQAGNDGTNLRRSSNPRKRSSLMSMSPAKANNEQPASSTARLFNRDELRGSQEAVPFWRAPGYCNPAVAKPEESVLMR